MLAKKWNIKKDPLFNKYIDIVGPQGVGKTSCASTIFILDYKYHHSKRTKIANDFIQFVNLRRKVKIPLIKTHLYFSNVDIVLDKKKNIHTHLVHLEDLSLPDKEKLNYFPKGSIFFIQEADSEADSRDWKNLSRGLVEFSKRFRHMQYTILVDMQLSENFDKKLRNLLTNIWFVYYSGEKRKFIFFKRQQWWFYDLQNQLNDFVKNLASVGVNIKLDVIQKRTLIFKPEIFTRFNSFSSDVYFLNDLVEYVFKEHTLIDYSEKSIETYIENNPLSV